MEPATQAAALQHAIDAIPAESCGLVVVVRGRERYIPCRNISEEPGLFFQIHPHDYARAEDLGEVTAVVHSHPGQHASAQPSQPDLVACERSGLPWFIICPASGTWGSCSPSGYRAPLIGRQYVFGLQDCYSCARDWYLEQGITLPDWERPKTQAQFEADPLFARHWAEAGFKPVQDEIQVGDAIFMDLCGAGLNHIGVYVGEQMILHHLAGRLSSRDIFGGYLMKQTGWIGRLPAMGRRLIR